MARRKEYRCDVCKKVYRTQWGKQYHTHIHNPSPFPVKCSFCPRLYPAPFYKSQHEQRCHSDELFCTGPKLKLKEEKGEYKDKNAKMLDKFHMKQNKMMNGKTSGTEQVEKIRVFRCGYCTHAYFVESELKYHMLSEHHQSAASIMGNSVQLKRLGHRYSSANDRLDVAPSTSSAMLKYNGSASTFTSSSKLTCQSTVKISKPTFLEIEWKKTEKFTSLDAAKSQQSLSRKYSGTTTPIGNLLYCPYCGDQFFDKKYIRWHLKISHCDRKQIEF